MKNLMFDWRKMEEAADPTGENGGGDNGGVITGTEVNTGTEVKVKPEGGENGEVKDKGNDNAGAGEVGALTGDQPAEPEIDWEKMTDDDYIGKLTAPEGQKFNDDVMKAYAPLLREHKIDPKVFQKFLAKDAELGKAFSEKRAAEEAEAQKEAQEAFRKAGEEFRETYTPEQVKTMNSALSKIDDTTFKALVTKSPLANNKTMGKMLLAYAQVYGDDSVPDGKAGSGKERTFEQVWTGKGA